ncbi:MAG: Hsp20/alpha crystallin family protein [Candidatus Hadarchaeia archaeon]
MPRRKFPSIFEEIMKRMRKEMRRGFPFDREEESSEDFWHPFEKMMERFEEGSSEEWSEFVEEEETPEGKIRKFGPFVYGFSYSKRPGEEPEIREFGNVKPGKTGEIEPAPDGEREPLAEVVDLGNMYEVTFELPGISKDEINLSSTEKKMRLETNGERKYRKTISFDEPVNPDEVDANFKNGILTVEIEKKEKEKEEGKTIEV